MKLNERTWAGHIVHWIKQEIADGKTVFQEATNDEGVKMTSGITKFPDILLFIDKISGIVFNGWELKFPDTPADDRAMLENALEKAQRLQSNSFVTWNGKEAIIWKINNSDYSIQGLTIEKRYPQEQSISGRNDLSDHANYQRHEPKLKARLSEILADLGDMYRSGSLKEAVNISSNFVEAIGQASRVIIPQFEKAIKEMKGAEPSFREEFNRWKMYERAALKILSTSSRKKVELVEEEVLARFAFYNLIGKILFHYTLADNLPGLITNIEIEDEKNVKPVLDSHFEKARAIDYQAVFKPYFTDILPFSETVDKTVRALTNLFNTFSFRILPADTIGTILENLVPNDERQRFGQYFTSQVLANLAAFPAIQTNRARVFDPTCGTGAFLLSAYQILKYYGKTSHVDLLSQIWGNDISHFPAILSVINLHRQNVKEKDNFPRIIRDDFFNLRVGMELDFPDPINVSKKQRLSIPKFNAIVSNFPFVQQEDIPNKVLAKHFRELFQHQQAAFLEDKTFKVNERADYFTYCTYNALQFLEKDGRASIITSNAWLGKDYGFQFKKFLLDNFSVKYIVRSEAEHWFSDSQVSTIYAVLQLGATNEPTKFVTLNFRLHDRFDTESIPTQLKQIEELYFSIDTCRENGDWEQNKTYSEVFHHKEGIAKVTFVSKEILTNSLSPEENWEAFFIAADFFKPFQHLLANPVPRIYESSRGTRTGWNEMFVIPSEKKRETQIEKRFLTPYVKGPKELTHLKFSSNYEHFLFTCDKPLDELEKSFSGAFRWVKKFENAPNKNKSKTIAEANASNKPFWYSLRPAFAQIVTSINPYERFFFTYSDTDFAVDQRLIALNVKSEYDVELIAALLNSALTFLTIEMRGTSRNLGALDLNAEYFESLPILNPDLLSEESKSAIKSAFQPLQNRDIVGLSQEILKSDRIAFDKSVLRAFGIDEGILPALYQVLLTKVNNRVEMKNRNKTPQK